MMKLKFLRFDYQVLVADHLVLVLDDFDKAMQFAGESYKEAGAIIIPVPVFTVL
jgi:hypothetical protein